MKEKKYEYLCCVITYMKLSHDGHDCSKRAIRKKKQETHTQTYIDIIKKKNGDDCNVIGAIL